MSQSFSSPTDDTPMLSTFTRYWLPTIPLTVADVVARSFTAIKASLFRPTVASLTKSCLPLSRALYDGHRVSISHYEHPRYPNRSRYWRAEYFAEGHVILAQDSDLTSILVAAKREYDNQFHGSSVLTQHLDTDQARLALALGYRPYTLSAQAAHDAAIHDERHTRVTEAIRLENDYGVAATRLLIESATVEEYDARLQTVLPSFMSRATPVSKMVT